MQIVFLPCLKDFHSFTIGFSIHHLYVVNSIIQSFSLLLIWKHFHLVLHSLVYHSNDRFIYSILFYLFFSFSYPSYRLLECIAISTVDINCSVLLSFPVLFDDPAFLAKVNSIHVYAKRLLQCITTKTNLAESKKWTV